MINQLLDELRDSWGYSVEEIIDIRDKMETLYHRGYWDGYGESPQEIENYYTGFSAYGKSGDFE